MAMYRKKPVVIEAVQWNGNKASLEAIGGLAYGGNRYVLHMEDKLEIPTLEGVMTANIGDWIIKGVSGEVYPCKPDIFEMTYEKVE